MLRICTPPQVRQPRGGSRPDTSLSNAKCVARARAEDAQNYRRACQALSSTHFAGEHGGEGRCVGGPRIRWAAGVLLCLLPQKLQIFSANELPHGRHVQIAVELADEFDGPQRRLGAGHRRYVRACLSRPIADLIETLHAAKLRNLMEEQ